MLPGFKPAPNIDLFIKKHDDRIMTLAPPKYSVEDWNYANNTKLRMIWAQQRLRERLEIESKRVINEVKETTRDWQAEVEYQTKERIDEIQFLYDELIKQKKSVIHEIEALSVYRNRLKRAIEFVYGKSLSICQQCLVWREKRIGVDLCSDEVDRDLCREMKTIKGCQDLLNATLKSLEEQIRQLKAASIVLEDDMESKYKALLIDKKNLLLKQSQQNLGEGMDLTNNICVYTLQQWKTQTYDNIEKNSKELSTAGPMRNYIDLILKQVCEDLRNQTETTNAAFTNSINQIKQMKRLMEDKHKEITINIAQVQDLIKELEQELVDKERSMLLCRTRLSNRAQRPGLELACDSVHDTLNRELRALQVTICKLKQKLLENKSLLRYLLHVQMIQEEDINIKANTIKIDEVDCMTLRSALVYTSF